MGRRVAAGVAGAAVDASGEMDCEVVQADTSTEIPSVAESKMSL